MQPSRIPVHCVSLIFCILGLFVSGCSSPFVYYKHTAGRPLKVAVNPNVQLNERMAIIGLKQNFGAALAMAPGVGAIGKAAGTAMRNSEMQWEPVPQEVVKETFLGTFTAGLKQDPRFQIVPASQAEAMFHFKLNAAFSTVGAFDSDLSGLIMAESELRSRDGARLWRNVPHVDDVANRERHDAELVRKDAAFRTRVLEKTARDVAQEQLAHLRRKR